MADLPQQPQDANPVEEEILYEIKAGKFPEQSQCIHTQISNPGQSQSQQLKEISHSNTPNGTPEHQGETQTCKAAEKTRGPRAATPDGRWQWKGILRAWREVTVSTEWQQSRHSSEGEGT